MVYDFIFVTLAITAVQSKLDLLTNSSFCSATRITMTTSRVVLSLIREENKREKKKEIKKRERELVFNQGQILIWHVLARAIKYNHQKAHHLFSLLYVGTSPPLLLAPQKPAPLLPSFKLVLALSN